MLPNPKVPSKLVQTLESFPRACVCLSSQTEAMFLSHFCLVVVVYPPRRSAIVTLVGTSRSEEVSCHLGPSLRNVPAPLLNRENVHSFWLTWAPGSKQVVVCCL